MEVEPAAASESVAQGSPLKNSVENHFFTPVKIRHHCAFPGCLKEIRRKSDAATITQALIDTYPILHSWVTTYTKEAVDNGTGVTRVIKHIVYDRWHKPCQRAFYAKVENGEVILHKQEELFASIIRC
jgi:hypothetical protein